MSLSIPRDSLFITITFPSWSRSPRCYLCYHTFIESLWRLSQLSNYLLLHRKRLTKIRSRKTMMNARNGASRRAFQVSYWYPSRTIGFDCSAAIPFLFFPYKEALQFTYNQIESSLINSLVFSSLFSLYSSTMGKFQDVSNSNRIGTNSNAKQTVAKRTHGVKTRSMSIAGQNGIRETATTRSGAFTRTTMEETIMAEQRNNTVMNADPNSYQMTGTVDNIDDRDQNDPLCVTSYVNDMYNHFRIKETITSVRPVYMESQPHINQKMRSILVDWLIEVHLKFKLVPETLYLTVNLIDRYLERAEVSRAKLQLVGVSCLLVASKYEEIYPPELRDLVYICDRAYTRQDVSWLNRCTCLSLSSGIRTTIWPYLPCLFLPTTDHRHGRKSLENLGIPNHYSQRSRIPCAYAQGWSCGS